MQRETEHRVDFNRERKADAPKGADAAAARIARDAKACPNDRALAIAAKCIRCRGSSSDVRGCRESSCPLHKLRPFQMDVVPAGTRHVRHYTNDIEQPAGIDPSEPEEVDDG